MERGCPWIRVDPLQEGIIMLGIARVIASILLDFGGKGFQDEFDG
jgi:hypothetical protein